MEPYKVYIFLPLQHGLIEIKMVLGDKREKGLKGGREGGERKK